MCSGCYSSILCDMHVYEKFHLLFCLALLEIQRSQRVTVEINTCSLLVFVYTNAELGHVCFSESSFRETIFQTFLCLIRKVGQRKTFSGQQKTLSSQFQSKKNLAWFLGKYFFFSCVCFLESDFREIIF